jgi:hypothetical protein
MRFDSQRCMLLVAWAMITFVPDAGGARIYRDDVVATASSSAGAKYGPAKSIDGEGGTRWATQDHAPLPQWLELRFPEPRMVDYVYLQLSVDSIYSPWAALTLTFGGGEPVEHTVEAGQDIVEIRFPARETDLVRISATALHEARNYVGIYECFAAYDPEKSLGARTDKARPVTRAGLEIRGRKVHPCVNLTPEDVVAARHRVATLPWARAQRDAIVARADTWLRNDDAYWLSFLPEPGACYAYGFTACPLCDGRTGTWHGANCSWDRPGQVRCGNGHDLPNAEHPDEGEGHTAPDGRIHYFKGQFNAWATEQWTQHALPALTEAYLLTEDERYAERAALLLDGLAAIYKESTSGSWDYPSNPPSGRFARPWYQVARTLVKYVDFHDRLYNSPALDTPSLRPGFSKRANIEENLLLDGAYYCYEHAFAGALHNGHADYLRGALAVGCLLDIPEYIRIAVEGPFSIRTMLANNIDRDGRYYESSLGYGIHARSLYLTFADPLFNLRSEAYPEGINLYDDPALRAAILLPDTQVMLAGRRPNFGDSAPDTRYIPPGAARPNKSDISFLERLHARTANPVVRADYAALLRWSNSQGNDDVEWALWHGRSVEAPAAQTTLPASFDQRIEGAWVAGMKGMALLRSGDQAVLLRYGPSLNHGDPDDLGLTYYAEGHQLSYDLGYGLGSTHAHVGWASSTVSHALVTVNEKNQLAAEGSGGSLHWFAARPHTQAVSVSSEGSYASEGVTTYRRSVALVDGAYLVDLFQVAGGKQHDFGFGSVGTALEPFGVSSLDTQRGSLAAGYNWGRHVGADGDIIGQPNKPYWNPPPGNGYGFFNDIRRGKPAAVWGATWRIPGDQDASMRMHVLGDGDASVFANAPGLYPSKPDASYLLARRSGDAPLESTFLAVYEPFTGQPTLASVRRVGPTAVEVTRENGTVDVILFGAQQADTGFGQVEFRGDFASLAGEPGRLRTWETLGSGTLTVAGTPLLDGAGEFVATVTAIDLDGRSVALDKEVPVGAEGLVAVFSNPSYSRTTAYHLRSARENILHLEAGSLSLGMGRAWEIRGDDTILSDIPHEYAKQVKRRASGFFDGKTIRGETGAETRVVGVQPGSPMTITVGDATAFHRDEQFVYLDIAPGDTLRISLPGGSGKNTPSGPGTDSTS